MKRAAGSVAGRNGSDSTYSSEASGGDMAEHLAQTQVNRSALAWMFVAQGLTLLPLFFYLPKWLPFLWAAAVILRVQVFRGVWGFPSSTVKALLGAVGVGGLYLSFNRFLGIEPMVAFLVLAFTLKLVEVKSRNDLLLVLSIGFVAIAAQLIFNQTLWLSFYGVACTLVLLAALQSLFQHRHLRWRRQLKHSLVILLQAIPVMLLLFITMPRLGQIWSVPLIQEQAKMGFSEDMSPGDLANLARNNAIAFRVSFNEGDIPAPQNRYWRGLVLDAFDGRKWERKQRWYPIINGARSSSQLHPDWRLNNLEPEQRYDYSVMLEPHGYSWLFTLMPAVKVESQALRTLFTNNYLLLATERVTARSYYKVQSLQRYSVSTEQLSVDERDVQLALPKVGNPGSRRLVADWQAQNLSAEAIVNRALAMFGDDFTYTLQPPTLGVDSIDEFLFESQRGFCEHFASAFTFLMRAAGIPARVVVGYQGGEYKTGSEHLVVRQSDAHAWAEIWLEGRGWIRVDPTAAVAPARIERGFSESLNASDSDLVRVGADAGFAGMWVYRMQSRIEQWDYLWHKTVLSWDNEKKSQTLQRLLGSLDPWRTALFFIGSLFGLLGLYFLMGLALRSRPRLALETQLLNRAKARLSSRGFISNPSETPRAFAARVKSEFPQLGTQFDDIVSSYERVAYRAQPQAIALLRRRVAKFRP